jgi:hypothetical protein
MLGTPAAAVQGVSANAGELQYARSHVLLHNYNDTDTVATCGAAEPVVAGLAIAATGVSTVTAANDIVEITTGVSPLKEGVVALGGNEDIYNGIRTGLDVATMLTPGGGGKTKVVEGALGFAASHTDDAVRVASTCVDDAARATGGGVTRTPGTPPPNLTPEGAGRSGAFNEAKRASGVPTSSSPINVSPATGKEAGQAVSGRDYTFANPAGANKPNVTINEHYGHTYLDDPTQNRSPHFNDIYGNHYDY